MKAADRAQDTPVVADPITTLCPRCGLCCNGVLFADVEIGRRTAPPRWQSAG